MPPISRKSIDRAGLVLRDWWTSDEDIDIEHRRAARLLWAYRLTYRRPLKTVTVGLRQFVKRESSDLYVAQRLKRLPTIIDKLTRHPTMKVTRMQDIGGCRTLLADLDEIAGVRARIEKNWDVRRIFDYVDSPKPTGYRAVHVVVMRFDREIEVQLRTVRQHAWAAEVERLGSLLSLPQLKDGVGPTILVKYYKTIADILALQDGGLPADANLARRFRKLGEKVKQEFPQAVM